MVVRFIMFIASIAVARYAYQSPPARPTRCPHLAAEIHPHIYPSPNGPSQQPRALYIQIPPLPVLYRSSSQHPNAHSSTRRKRKGGYHPNSKLHKSDACQSPTKCNQPPRGSTWRHGRRSRDPLRSPRPQFRTVKARLRLERDALRSMGGVLRTAEEHEGVDGVFFGLLAGHAEDAVAVGGG